MKSITNKNSIFNLVLLAIFVFGAFSLMPNKAEAVIVKSGASAIIDNSNNNNNNSNNYYNNNSYQNPIPVIYSISPNSGTTNTSAKMITVTGNNFVPTSIVRWSESDRATNYVNSTTLTVILTDYDMTGLGTYSVTVYNPTPSGGISNRVFFNLSKTTINNSGTKPSSSVSSGTSSNRNGGSTAISSKDSTQTSPTKSSANKKSNSLAASSIFGADGFMPKTIFEWFLLVIIMLFIVLVGRKVLRRNQKFQSSPLKHA